jgi:uncharacterized protein YggT (Ycf19 family)
MGGFAVLALLFDAVSKTKSFVDVFIFVYTLIIFAYILMSWVRLPYSPWLNLIQRFLSTFGPLDLSPVVAVLFLYLLRAVIDSVLDRIH